MDVDLNLVEGVNLMFSVMFIMEIIDYVYFKGYWLWDEDDFIYYQVIMVFCFNEDVNGNGMLDVGEDLNGDGRLIFGNIVVIDVEVIIDENGQVLIFLNYF